MSNIDKDIGERIRGIRLELKLSMEKFGRLLTPIAASSLISNWENGNAIPKTDRMQQIAILGNTTIDYILTGNRENFLHSRKFMLSLNTLAEDELKSFNFSEELNNELDQHLLAIEKVIEQVYYLHNENMLKKEINGNALRDTGGLVQTYEKMLKLEVQDLSRKEKKAYLKEIREYLVQLEKNN